MNLLLLDASELDPRGRATLNDRRAEHLLRVLRVSAGKTLRAGVLDQGFGEASVVEVDAASVTLQYVERRSLAQEAPRVLILALPRPKVLSRCLAHAAALGFSRVALVRCQRSEKAHLSSHRLSPARVLADCRLGLEQGGHVGLPVVRVFERFKPFVEDSLEEFVEGTPRFAAHLHGGATIADLERRGALAPTLRYTLAIGPEGGFVPYEAELLVSHGFLLLSSSVGALRVESALSYFSGQLDALACVGRMGPPSLSGPGISL